jgi:transposase
MVAAYLADASGTYAETAKLFGVGEATVSRNLRRYRDTGDVAYKPKGGNNPRRVDLAWMRQNLDAQPDARLIDRVEAWFQHSGQRVSIAAIWSAVHACGWTHKKRRWSPANGTGRR